MRKQILLLLLILLAPAAVGAQTAAVPDSLSCELQEVVVTSRQPATRFAGHTLVSTIPGTPLQNLGTALDVLAQLPLIGVADNEVTVTGRGTPEIFIDGRPLTDPDQLRRLLSENLRRVELDMAPGAEYASTTRAVIRISTRRNFIDGLSLTEKADLTMRRRFSANDMLDLAYRARAWDFFISGTLSRNRSLAKGSTVNRLVLDGDPVLVGSSQHSDALSESAAVKAGLNYASDARSGGAYYRFAPERSSLDNTGQEWLDAGSPLLRRIGRHIHGRSHLLSLYYEETLGDDGRLHFDGDYNRTNSDSRVSTVYPDAAIDAVSSDQYRCSSLLAAKLYANFPLFGGKITLGTQDSYTRTRLDFRMLNETVGGYIPSVLTDVRQTSAALFGSWDRNFGNLSLTAGLRFEYADYDFRRDGKRDSRLCRRDRLLTPDLRIAYAFSEEAQVDLSYRMAVVKPPYSHLTGGLNYVGIHEIEGGNQALRDERMHDFRLFGSWRGFMLQADFTRSLDSYAFVKEIYPAPTLQLLLHPVNIDVSALDLFLIWGGRIGCWMPELSAGVYRQWLTLGGRDYDRPIFSYDFKNIVTLPKEFLLTVNLSGQSEGDMHTNCFGSTLCRMDLSVEKSLLKKSLSLRLTATDLLNTRNNDWSMRTFGISVDKRQSYDRRGLTLSLIYRLHPRKSTYKGQSASPSELNRL